MQTNSTPTDSVFSSLVMNRLAFLLVPAGVGDRILPVVRPRAFDAAGLAAMIANMSDPRKTIERLRAMIGRQLRYQGMPCTLVEVLADPPVVVLRPIGGEPVIQADNFGKAVRHAPPFFELPVFAPDGASLSAELQMINLPEGSSTTAD